MINKELRYGNIVETVLGLQQWVYESMWVKPAQITHEILKDFRFIDKQNGATIVYTKVVNDRQEFKLIAKPISDTEYRYVLHTKDNFSRFTGEILPAVTEKEFKYVHRLQNYYFEMFDVEL